MKSSDYDGRIPEPPYDANYDDLLLTEEVDQLRTQLAGCMTAADGVIYGNAIAHQGDYGWSPAYQLVLELRVKYDAAIERIAELDALFELQHRRTTEADALYVAAHPKPEYPHGYRPDLGQLVHWLLRRADAAEAELAKFKSAIRENHNGYCNDFQRQAPASEYDAMIELFIESNSLL